MKSEVELLSGLLASDRSISNDDFWRALRTVDHELHRLTRTGSPIPMNVIYVRRILDEARRRRGLD